MANETYAASEILTAAKLNRISGAGASIAYTPTLSQSAAATAITKTVEYAAYKRRADTVFVEFSLAVTGVGVAAQPIRVGLPPLNLIAYRPLAGQFAVFDASAGLWYIGAPFFASAQVVQGQGSGAGSPFGQAIMTAALAAGDVVAGSVIYQTSS